MNVPREEYEVLELIGRGSFGQIHKVRRKRDGHILARKGISYLKMSQKEKEQVVNEFNILSKLSHPNIVQYYHREHDRAEQSLYIYMEYCGGGDLSSRIKACRAEGTLVPEPVVWTIFTQIVLALHRCHNGSDALPVSELFSRRERRRTSSGLQATALNNGKEIILHRDLKPENVFLDHENSVKLGDFGLSRILASEQHLATTYVGTPYYMSPEIVCDLPYTSRSDIWSLGCMIYELCCLTPPFNAKSHLGLCQKIKEGRYAPLPAQYSSELKRVIDTCLRVNPSERPDTSRLLDLDIMRLVRKELEATEVGRVLRLKEETLKKKERDLDSREKELAHQLETVVTQMKSKITAELHASWELKAETEIQRRVDIESKRLFEEFKSKYEAEMNVKFQDAVRNHTNKGLNRQLNRESLPSERFAGLNLNVVPEMEEATANRSQLPDPGVQSTTVHPKGGLAPVPKPSYVPPPSPMDISMSSPVQAPRLFQRNTIHGSPLQTRGSNLSKMVRCHSAAVAIGGSDFSSDDEDGEDCTRPTTSKPPPPRPFPLLNMKSAPALSQALDLQSAVHQRAPKRSKPAPGTRFFQKDVALTSLGNTQHPHLTRANTDFEHHGDVEIDGGEPFLNVNAFPNGKPKAKSIAELAKEAKIRGREINKEVNKENEWSSLGAAVWNPEVDDMPSPFLSRRRAIA